MTYEQFVYELDYLDDQRCERCKQWIQTYPPKDSLREFLSGEPKDELCDSCNIKWYIINNSSPCR